MQILKQFNPTKDETKYFLKVTSNNNVITFTAIFLKNVSKILNNNKSWLFRMVKQVDFTFGDSSQFCSQEHLVCNRYQ